MIEYAQHGDVRIAYETFGDPASGEPLVMIMGLDFTMVWWHDDLCRALVEAGFAVVRFDNRDTGLSTRFSTPQIRNQWATRLGRSRPAYTTIDMVGDIVAVLDALGWASAHVLGASMGGALAQATALFHPSRVRSVTSIMSLPAGLGMMRTLTYLQPSIFAKIAKARKPAETPQDEIDNLVATYRLCASPGFPLDEQFARRAAELTVERGGVDPGTTSRQLSASKGVRLPKLSTITVPTLAINGEADPLIKPKGGRDTAKQIPGARFVSYPGMGHDFPRALWPPIIDQIRTTTHAATSS